MKREQFRRELEYGAVLAIADALLRKSLITAAEHRRIKAKLICEYRPAIGSIHDDSPRIG